MAELEELFWMLDHLHERIWQQEDQTHCHNQDQQDVDHSLHFVLNFNLINDAQIQYEAAKLRAKQKIIIRNESQYLQRNAMIAEIKAEDRMRGAELADTIELSIPMDSHAGTRMIAPPIPSIPPANPPANPNMIAFFIQLSDILSYSFQKTQPRLIFFSSV